MDEKRRAEMERIYRWIMDQSGKSAAFRIERILQGKVYQPVDAALVQRVEEDLNVSLIKGNGESLTVRMNPIAATHLATQLSEICTPILQGRAEDRKKPDLLQ